MIRKKICFLWLILFGWVIISCKTQHLSPRERIQFLTYKAFDERWKIVNFEGKLEEGTVFYYGKEFVHRPNLFPDKLYGIRTKTYIPNVDERYLDIRFPLHIPEEYNAVYKYFDDNMEITDYQAAICFFSPLLPTMDKDIFVQQQYSYSYQVQPNGEVERSQQIFHTKYKVTGNKIEELDFEMIYMSFYSDTLEEELRKLDE